MGNPLARLLPSMMNGRLVVERWFDGQPAQLVEFLRTPTVMLVGGPSALRPFVVGSDRDLDSFEQAFFSPWSCVRVVRVTLSAMMAGRPIARVCCLGCNYDHVCWHCNGVHACRRCGSPVDVPSEAVATPLALLMPRLHDGRLVLNTRNRPLCFFVDLI